MKPFLSIFSIIFVKVCKKNLKIFLVIKNIFCYFTFFFKSQYSIRVF